MRLRFYNTIAVKITNKETALWVIYYCLYLMPLFLFFSYILFFCFCLDYISHSLCGSPLFSLIHLLLCLPPQPFLTFVERGFIGLFTALNKINKLSPAYDIMEMQEMKWPFASPGRN